VISLDNTGKNLCPPRATAAFAPDVDPYMEKIERAIA